MAKILALEDVIKNINDADLLGSLKNLKRGDCVEITARMIYNDSWDNINNSDYEYFSIVAYYSALIDGANDGPCIQANFKKGEDGDINFLFYIPLENNIKNFKNYSLFERKLKKIQ